MNDNIYLTGDLMGDTEDNENDNDGEEDANGDAAQSHGNTNVTENAAAGVLSSLKQKRVGSSQGGHSRKNKAKQTLLLASKKKHPPPPPKLPWAVAKSPRTTTPSKGTPTCKNPQPRHTPSHRAKGAKTDKKADSKASKPKNAKERGDSSVDDDDEEEEEFKETEESD